MLFDRGVDSLALRESQRHGLFHNHVLLSSNGGNDMLGMQMAGGSHIDGIDVRAFAHLLDAIEYCYAEFLVKLF